MTNRSHIRPGHASREFERRKQIIFSELRQRTTWFIQLRWLVPPGIILGVQLAQIADFAIGTPWRLYLLALAILVYNICFFYLSHGLDESKANGYNTIKNFTQWQVVLDYLAMFLLVHFTGGMNSPCIFFFFIHIVIAAILLNPLPVYGFATLVALGMTIMCSAEQLGWLERHPLGLGAHAQPPGLGVMIVHLVFFAAAIFITSYFATTIIGMVRRRIRELVSHSEKERTLSNRLEALNAMFQAILSLPKKEQILEVVTSELAQVMKVMGISVKLLSKDGTRLNFVASHGIDSAATWQNSSIEVQKSPLNREIIEGKPFVTGHVTESELFQFGVNLKAAQVQSVLFVPLSMEERVIGILGAYCSLPERFSTDEVYFFRQAARLVAIAIENSRRYEEIEALVKSRSWFMLRVAHNLRSPLAAIASMLSVLRGNYLGEFNDKQGEHLRRIDRRVQSLIDLIGELLTLAHHQSKQNKMKRTTIDLVALSGRINRTFEDKAKLKNLEFRIQTAKDLPLLEGDVELIEQALENVIANAIKYTPSGGKVEVRFGKSNCASICIEVKDDGIGIPKNELGQLFGEFFRASNARKQEEPGTGLGLTIVKEIVELHGGRIVVESEEGLGSLFVLIFPIATERAQS